MGKQLKRDGESMADAQICLTCPLPFCTGTDKCFRNRKKQLNHGRTPRNCRRTVENGNRWGTGGSGGEAVKKSPLDLDFDFEIPDFDSLLDDIDLDFSLDEIDLDFS